MYRTGVFQIVRPKPEHTHTRFFSLCFYNRSIRVALRMNIFLKSNIVNVFQCRSATPKSLTQIPEEQNFYCRCINHNTSSFFLVRKRYLVGTNIVVKVRKLRYCIQAVMMMMSLTMPLTSKYMNPVAFGVGTHNTLQFRVLSQDLCR